MDEGVAKENKRGSSETDLNSPDAKLVGVMADWVDTHLKATAKYRKEINNHRKYVRGRMTTEEDENEIVRTNLVYSTIAAMLPRIYAKNPEIAVRPSEAVHPKQYKTVRGFARTLGIVLNRQLEDAKIKRRAKANVRSAMTTAIGWVKLTYQKDIETDPIIQSRINDIQDNLKRIEYLQEGDDIERGNPEAEKRELELQLQALEAQSEVVVAEGLVVDRLLSEDVIIDGDIRDFDCYADARRIAHRIWYTAEAYEQTFGKAPTDKAKTFTDAKQETTGPSRVDGEKARFAVWEIWDKTSQTVFTWCEGELDWAREPYTPDNTPEQWYPFFPLGFNLVDGQFMPMSDVELLIKLQEEYNITRDQLAQARERNKPHYIADADTKEQDITKKQFAEIGEVIIVDAKGRPIREVFASAEMMQLDYRNYDTSPIRADIDMVSGQTDADRGAVAKAKTATEAEILQAGLSSRTEERQDAIEDWMYEIAKASAEILLQELSYAQVVRIAGPEAVWPELQKQEVFDLVNIEIRAGTSGKPNKAREQQVWMELLPLMRELIGQVSELRSQGRTEDAEVLVKLGRETLRRADERIDVEEFLPQEQGEDQSRAMEEMRQMQQQMAAMQVELDEARARIRKLDSETLKNEVEAEIAAANASQPMPPPASPTIQ
ncbi:MAG TPA: hypothetical protein ENJ18_10580 [Nannocystis exedens]|nr:hypothetical protein [Nannocystis exedens]